MALPGKRMLLAGLALALMAPARLEAQDSVPPLPVRADSAVADSTLQGAPVVVGRDTLFRIHARLGPLGPEARAQAIADRVRQVSQGVRAGSDAVVVGEVEGQTVVMAGDVILMAVLAGDVLDTTRTPAILAAEYADALRSAMTRGGFQWRLKIIGIGILLTLLATGGLLGIGWLVARGSTRLAALISLLRGSKRLPTLRLQQLEIVSADRIADALLVVAKVLQFALWAVLLYFYLVLVLSFFPWTEPLSERILDYVFHPLGVVAGSIASYLPNLFFIAIIVLVTRYVLRFIHFLFRALETGLVALPNFDPDWAEPTYKLVRFLVLAFALIVLFPYLPGSKSDAFKGVSLFVGVLFSLGSTGAVSNLVAGSLLTYTRAFQIGDRVKIGETVGDVVARTLLVTRVRTVYKVDVTIPNATVMSSQVLNYSANARKGGVIIQSTITIGYDVPWRRVHELLLAAAGKTESVAPEPPPFVLQTGLNDYYPAYELNVHVLDATAMRRVLSDLNAQIQDTFAEGGVEITSPAFHAVRDGNPITIPAPHTPAGPAPAFRVQRVPDGGGNS